MNNTITIFLFILFAFNCSSQNLVPNPSFEQHDTCPDNQNQVSFVIGWDNGDNSTPDYFNSCSSNFSVPTNWGGYQQAYYGNAYCGLYTYEATPPYNVREFLRSQLSSSLLIGQKYFVSFKVSLSLVTSGIDFNSATNNLGALFSTIPNLTISPVNNFSHIWSSSIITDTCNWVNISGSFISDSTYQYIYIGNFYDDENTSLSYLIDTNIAGLSGAYYFIDNVCVSTDSLECNSPTIINKANENTKLNIYPNPTTGKINIEAEGILGVELYNLQGQCIMRDLTGFQNLSGLREIDLSNHPKGIYFVKVTTKEGVAVEKVILN